MPRIKTIPEEAANGPSYIIVKKDIILQECYLCGSEGTTKEHVIPKVVFAPNHIEQPIVLRACQQCNKAKGRDDEYATRQLQATSFNNGSSIGLKHWLKRFDSPIITPTHVQRAGMGILNDIRSRMHHRDLTGNQGIVIAENSPAITLDGHRIDQFFVNIAKGLTVRETGCVFNWDEYNFTARHEQVIGKQTMLRDNQHPFWLGLQKNSFMRKWGDDFLFSGSSVKGPEGYASLWSFTMYSSHMIVILILPKTAKV